MCQGRAVKIPKNLKVEIKCHYLGLRLRCGACGWVRYFSTDVEFACLRAVRHSHKCLSLKRLMNEESAWYRVLRGPENGQT